MSIELTDPAVESPDYTKPPFLHRVCIRGYKSIEFCDVVLSPLTVLVGRNAAGKSNFLDSLAFLRDVMIFGAGEAVKQRGGWNSIASRSKTSGVMEFEVEVSFMGGRTIQSIRFDDNGGVASEPGLAPPNLEGHRFVAHYSLQLAGGPNCFPTIQKETLELTDEITGEKGGFDLRRSDVHSTTSVNEKQPGGLAFRDAIGALLWKGGNSWSDSFKQAGIPGLPPRSDYCFLSVIGFQPFLNLAEGLRSMGFYSFYPDAIRSQQKSSPGWLLEKDGHNLASVIAALNQIEPKTVERVRDYLQLISEEIQSFRVVRYGDNETVQFRLRQGTGLPEVEFDAESMSDGTLRALASLMAAFQTLQPVGPSVVGIEEPETALHPAAMHALVDALDDATQRTQIVLTTHSAELLSSPNITPAQVLVVRNRDGKTQITPMDPASREIINEDLYSLSDLQRMDKLDLDEADVQRQTVLSRGPD